MMRVLWIGADEQLLSHCTPRGWDVERVDELPTSRALIRQDAAVVVCDVRSLTESFQIWYEKRPYLDYLPMVVVCELDDRDTAVVCAQQGVRCLSTVSVDEDPSVLPDVIDRAAKAGTISLAREQLFHAEKFAAVGILAAEIAHEINNPAAFVITNLSVMLEYIGSVERFHSAIREKLKAGLLNKRDHQLMVDEHEIEFLDEDLQTLVSRSLVGLERIHQIVLDLRYFSQDRTREFGWVNIEHLIESVANLVRHDAKFKAQLIFDFDNVPLIHSDADRLSQVLLNMLVNAVHAIEPGDVDHNEIRVTSRMDGECIVVAILDTGCGIPHEMLGQIFAPFFTTKELGLGTGLGLSISRDIVVALGGTIGVESEPGRTRFQIRLPIGGT